MARVPVNLQEDTFNLPLGFDWVVTSDPEFHNALTMILKTHHNLFINGPAGTGKTVLIQLAYKMLKGSVLPIATTGISASQLSDKGVPAATIHSGLQLEAHDIYSVNYTGRQREKETIALLENIDVILIEEVGMCSSSLFDEIGKLVKIAERRRKKPIRIICFGDVLQLPPVVRDSDKTIKMYYQKEYNGNIFFFNSHFYREANFFLVDLRTIYRQSDDSFQNILNRLRLDCAEESDFEVLNRQVTDLDEFRKRNSLSLILAPKVNTVRELNLRYGKPKNSRGCMIYSAVANEGFDWGEAGLVEEVVTIWEGQQVMCIYNDEERLFQNGTLGIVEEIFEDSVLIRRRDDRTVLVKKHKWIQWDYSYDSETGEVEPVERGHVVQIGCKPAVASTIHKSQGLTLDSVYLYLKDGWIPNSGVYLGLSRCRSLEGIGISRPLSQKDIFVLDEPFNFVVNS